MSKPPPTGRGLPSRSLEGAPLARAGIERRARRREAEVAAGRDEQCGRRRDERVRVVTEPLPRSKIHHARSAVVAETADHRVVVAREAREARGVDGDRAAERVVVVEDVVANRVARGAAADVDAPATVRRVDDGVVDDEVVGRAGGAVDPIEADAARVVVVEEVVADDAVRRAPSPLMPEPPPTPLP